MSDAAMTEVDRVLAALTTRHDRRNPLLIMSDYDGTLSPIVSEPAEAWLAREARQSLRALARSPRCVVGIISGRELGDIRSRVGVPGVIYAGCHGLEVEGPGIRFEHPNAAEVTRVLSIIGRALGFRLAPVRGVLVEPKGLAVAVHVRNVAPEDVPWVEAEVADIVGPREDLRILRGRKVLEILPAGGWHKGRCALRIREHVAASAQGSFPMLYLGDDGTDEPAFWVLRSVAVTVRVGQRGPSHAAFRFDDVADTHRLLSALAAELGLPDTA